MMPDSVLKLGSYLIEVAVVAVIYIALRCCVSTKMLLRFGMEAASSWTTLVDVLLGVTFSVWVAVFVNLMFTEFGQYLRNRGVSRFYLYAFAVPGFAFLAADICLRLTAWSRSEVLAHISVFILSYAFLNLVTTVTNGIGLASLFGTYREYTSGHGDRPS